MDRRETLQPRESWRVPGWEPFNSWELTAKQGRQIGPADPPSADQAQAKQLCAKKVLPASVRDSHESETSSKVLNKI